MPRNNACLVAFFLILAATTPNLQQPVLAQSLNNTWSEFVDISNTATASTYPSITADTAGNVHVLWSEDVGGKTDNLQFNPDGSPALDPRGNRINLLTADGNSLFYTRWNGLKWTTPVDIQVNYGGKVQYPKAVVDRHGVLHAVWVNTVGAGAELYYSSAPANKADSAQEWSEPHVIADSVLFAYYPADIATDLTGGLHIIYAQVGAEPGAYAVNSFDGGKTWSTPVELYRIFESTQQGVSSTRLVEDGKGRLHASWSRYGADGNGKGIYYSQSQDLGRTWSKPMEVAAWQPGWYEVDWLSVGVVEDEIHLVWEGSSDVAALNERISDDGGLTWSAPHRILPKLVGENGFAELVVDSASQMHMLVVQRGDPASITHGVWYTSWDKGFWQDPVLLDTSTDYLYSMLDKLSPSQLQNLTRGSFTGGGLRYQRATIVNGNELFMIVVNEQDGDIWSSHTTLVAPHVQPQPYLQPTPGPTQVFVATSQPKPILTPTVPNLTKGVYRNQDANANIGGPVLMSSLTVFLLLFVIAISVLINRHNV